MSCKHHLLLPLFCIYFIIYVITISVKCRLQTGVKMQTRDKIQTQYTFLLNGVSFSNIKS